MAYRHALLSLACLLPLLAHAASFDCTQANHPVERAICADGELSSLDEHLADAFRNARQFNVSGDDSLLQGQRQWLRDTREHCQAQAAVADCVRNRYGWRLEELAALPSPLDTFKTFDTSQALHLDGASQTYDFRLALDQPCTEQTCESSGQLAIFAKGQTTPQQVIALPGVFLSHDDAGNPLLNSAQRYEYQGVINVGDFNFDGHQDFAVQNGNHGSYGGPSYDVFLYDPQHQAFRYASAMSGLIASTLGFFGVDQQAQLLETFAKSGCCWHRNSRYRVESNMPVEVWRTTDGASEHMSGPVREVEEWRNGRWHLLQRVQLEQYE